MGSSKLGRKLQLNKTCVAFSCSQLLLNLMPCLSTSAFVSRFMFVVPSSLSWIFCLD